MKIDAGELDTRISIVTPTGAVDPVFGGATGASQTVATVWAKCRFGAGGEVQKSGQIDSITRADFFIRFRTDIKAGMFVVHRNGKYKIINPIEIERRAWVQLACEAHDDKPT